MRYPPSLPEHCFGGKRQETKTGCNQNKEPKASGPSFLQKRKKIPGDGRKTSCLPAQRRPAYKTYRPETLPDPGWPLCEPPAPPGFPLLWQDPSTQSASLPLCRPSVLLFFLPDTCRQILQPLSRRFQIFPAKGGNRQYQRRSQKEIQPGRQMIAQPL